MSAQKYYKPINPIKINYICTKCGRKRTITYNAKNDAGGLLSTQFELCMPFMYCPRCNKLTMKEVEENEKN